MGLSMMFLNTVPATVMAAENTLPVLTVEDVVNRMVQADDKRLADFPGYTAKRRHSLENKRVNKRRDSGAGNLNKRRFAELRCPIGKRFQHHQSPGHSKDD